MGARDGTTTIAAIASAPGGARRGVIRISGPSARDVVGAACRVDGGPPELEGRRLFTARFHDGAGEQPALVLWMPGPRSFTREDVAELHLPGAPPLLDAALSRLFALGAEPAQPGEFTRRAFVNGRIDLTRAEGVLALVSARNVEERRAASQLLVGGLADRAAALRNGLEAVRALCEASLDFDETDTGHVPEEELASGAERALAGLAEALSWEERRAPRTGEPLVVLAGAPNAGKSALFNRLTAGEALVSGAAGTTRDVVTGTWTLAGTRCRLADTAGVEERAEGVGRAAQDFAAAHRDAAELVLWVVDGAGPVTPLPPVVSPRVLVWNKIDLPDARVEPPASAREGEWVAVSAATGVGLEGLEQAAARVLGLGGASPSRAGLGRELAARHKHALTAAAGEVERGLVSLRAGVPLDLFAESLREATSQLDAITGQTTPDDLLDRIFARFCIGK